MSDWSWSEAWAAAGVESVMRMQDTQANCGPAAMSNALAALGINRPALECEKLCKTNAVKGTGPKQLVTGLKAIEGLAPVVLTEKRSEVAFLRLDKALRLGRPVIICVGDGSHWVAAIGRLGPRYLVADSADNDLVVSKSQDELTKWWAEKATNPYYGVICDSSRV